MSEAPRFMSLGERRHLSGGEIAFARGVFADEIAWPKVRVLQAPRLGPGAMVPVGRTIVFFNWRAWRDFSDAPLEAQGWFVHELAHVWQAKRGVVLALAKLGALGRGAYRYTPNPEAKFAAYNIEAQAEIVRHLFLARAGAPAEQAPPRAWLETAWASRASA